MVEKINDEFPVKTKWIEDFFFLNFSSLNNFFFVLTTKYCRASFAQKKRLTQLKPDSYRLLCIGWVEVGTELKLDFIWVGSKPSFKFLIHFQTANRVVKFLCWVIMTTIKTGVRLLKAQKMPKYHTTVNSTPTGLFVTWLGDTERQKFE